MNKLTPQQIRSLPEYSELLAKRRKITVPLAIVTLSAYFSFILMVAYTPDILGRTTADGITTIGIWFGLGLILLTFAITATYVWFANTRIEKLLTAIQHKAS